MQFHICGEHYTTTKDAQEAAAETLDWHEYLNDRQHRLDGAESLAEAMEICNNPYPQDMLNEIKADQLGRAYFNTCLLSGRKAEGCVFVDSNPNWGGKYVGVSYKALDSDEPQSHWFIVADGDCLPASYAEIFRNAGLDIYPTVKII